MNVPLVKKKRKEKKKTLPGPIYVKACNYVGVTPPNCPSLIIPRSPRGTDGVPRKVATIYDYGRASSAD